MRREPAFYVGLVEAVLAVLLSFALFGLDANKVALIMAVVVAGLGVYTAWATKDTMLGVGVGLAKAVLALSVGYGLTLTDAQTGALIALVTVALGSFQRTQTTPLARGTFRESEVVA